MNRQDRRGRMWPTGDQRLVLDQHGHESRLPVMHMHGLRRVRQNAREIGDTLGKEDESRGVVRIIVSAFAVKRGAFEEFGLVDENDLEVRRGLEGPNMRGDNPGSELDIDLDRLAPK